MVMDVLERSMDTDVYHERDPRAFDNYEMRDISTVHHLVDRSRARVVVIKALCEAQDLRRLLDEFAPAKAIWVLRSHEDTVNSMSVSFGNFAPQAKRIARDRNGSGWLGRGMSDETHEKIRALVKDDIDEASAAALQWYYRNVLFFEQGLMDDTRATLVRYEDVVARPEIAFYRLFDFLGIRFLPDHGRGIFGTSVRKAPPPVLSPAVQGLCMQLDERFRALCL